MATHGCRHSDRRYWNCLKWAIAGFILLCWTSPVWAAQNILNWIDNSNNENQFLIERKVESCAGTLPFAQIATVTTNVITYTDTAVLEGSTYCYRVRASNTAGQSAYSNTAGRTVPITIPNPPSGLGVT